MEYNGEIDELLKRTNGAGTFYFENRDEMCAYTTLLSKGRSFMVMGSQKYNSLCDCALKYASIGFHEKAIGLFEECLDLNPIGVRARLGMALCEIHTGEFDDALIDLADVFQYITDKKSAALLYEYYAKTHAGLGNYLYAAACLVHVKEFDSAFNVEKEMLDILGKNNINVDLALTRTEFVLSRAKVPVIDRKKMLERKRKYHKPFFYSEFNINAVIDGSTGEVITDPGDISSYNKETLIAYSFDTLDEALIFAANAKGKNVAQANRGEYLDLFRLGCEYVAEGRYEEALETFGECFILNPICLDARLNASYFHTYFNRFDEAKMRLDNMYDFIVNSTYAMLFYRYYGILENAMENWQTGAACFLYALNFRDDAISKNIVKWLEEEYGININRISKNPELILRNSGVPVLTKDEISRRRVYYRIDDR